MNEQDFLKNLDAQILEIPTSYDNNPESVKDYMCIRLTDWDKYILPLIKEL